MQEIKVGDFVQDGDDGLKTIVTRIEGDRVWGYWIDNDGTTRNHEQFSSSKNIRIIPKDKKPRVKKEKPEAPYRFLLQYDLDSDPLELYKTMAEVKARVVKLAETERYLKKDTIKVYELKGLPKMIKISTAIRVSK